MTDQRNISTEYQPKGSGRNPSDTLDRPTDPDRAVGESTDESERAPGEPPVVDETGQPLSGDGTVARNGDIATRSGATEAPPEPKDA